MIDWLLLKERALTYSVALSYIYMKMFDSSAAVFFQFFSVFMIIQAWI